MMWQADSKVPCGVVCEAQCVLTCCEGAGEGAGALGQQELTALNVELGESTTVVETYRALCSLQAELTDLQSLASGPDEDLRALAAEERDSLASTGAFRRASTILQLPLDAESVSISMPA